ncbi:MAG: TMEM14 family protein [Chloroherpetonaceae bacterium]|nr:TMEM14 family protein [Chloroherpetonaceae bacterium]
MNSIIASFGFLMIIIGIIGYLKSGSPTSFIGSAAGLLAIIGGYMYMSADSQSTGKWICFGSAVVVIVGVGMRIPGLVQKLMTGEESFSDAWVRIAMLVLSIAFAVYTFVVLKTTEQTGT